MLDQAEGIPEPWCDICQTPMIEDLTVAADARIFEPNMVIRQWRCLNAHAITYRSKPIWLKRRAPKWAMLCDICGKFMTALDAKARRHTACDAEYERRRARARLADLMGRGGMAYASRQR